MLSVAQIASMAVSAVSGAVSGAVHAATLARDTIGAYDPETGAHSITTTTQTGRAVLETTKPAQDIFPDYVAGPGDELVFLEGFTSCLENDRLTFAGKARTVLRAQDILGAGSIFYAICR